LSVPQPKVSSWDASSGGLGPVESASSARHEFSYRPDIDGLRGIAVFAVVAYHAGMFGFPGGYIGVDIFFVISGYLIGTMVFKEVQGGTFRLSTFYARRAKRILPALLCVLAFCYCAGFILLSSLDLWRFGAYALSTVASASNILAYLKSGYFQPNSERLPLLMTWSLGVEEQFYLLFPLSMLLIRKLKWKTQLGILAAFSAVSFAACVVLTERIPTAAFYLFPSRAWELAAGVMLAVLACNLKRTAASGVRSHLWSVVGLACITASTAGFHKEMPFPGYFALLPVLGSVMLIANPSGICGSLLSTKPFTFVGRISYSWYLWHWPLLSFARVIAPSEITRAAGFTLAALSFGLAILSYEFVEQPFRASRLGASKLLPRYALACALAAVPAVIAYKAPHLNLQPTAVQTMDREIEAEHFDPCIASDLEAAPRLSAECIPHGPGPVLALLGDSRASAIAQVMRSKAEAAGYQFAEMTKAACPALSGVSHESPRDPRMFRACGKYNEARLKIVLGDPRVKVAVLVGAWGVGLGGVGTSGEDRFALSGDTVPGPVDSEQSRTYFKQGLERLVEQLQAAGMRVYLLQDSPSMNFDPLTAMCDRLSTARGAIARLVSADGAAMQRDSAEMKKSEGFTLARKILVETAAQHSGVILYDLSAALCNGDLCRIASADRSFFADAYHLSRFGASVALQGLALTAGR